MKKVVVAVLGAVFLTVAIVVILLVRSQPCVSVSINAVPWAEVFIKLPHSNSYIEPQRAHYNIPPDPEEENPNVTPIRGGLCVPIGTTIKLSYRDTDEVFPYDDWKENESIFHDFMKP